MRSEDCYDFSAQWLLRRARRMILKITIRQRIHCDAVTVTSRTISMVVVAVTIGWCNVQGAVTVVLGIVATSCCRTLGTRGGESCATTPLFTRPTLPAQTTSPVSFFCERQLLTNWYNEEMFEKRSCFEHISRFGCWTQTKRRLVQITVSQFHEDFPPPYLHWSELCGKYLTISFYGR